MEMFIDLQSWPVRDVLDTLLRDKSAEGYIIWASDSYAQLGPGFDQRDEITPDRVTGMNRDLIQPRVLKARAEQAARTRQHAEVFTPAWICKKMCDVFDEQFAALPPEEYIRTRVLEITCGEAPFLTGRYDSATGEAVSPEERYGLFDRKLRAVNAAAQTEKEWLRLAKAALQSTYGYEFQGDSLLIARVNLLCAWCEALRLRWGREPNRTELKSAANTIAWNLWQMDGLQGTRPLSDAGTDFGQLSLFEDEPAAEPPVRIYDHRGKHSVNFTELREGVSGMKFDFVIGNPPYQEYSSEDSDNKTFAAPIYNKFLDSSYDIASKVELIHPARFLFNAGSTPKAWNEKMLQNSHFKVLYYEEDSSKVFSNTEIKGGVAITYHDESKDFGAIQVFTKYPELNLILKRVMTSKDFESMSQVVITRTAMRMTEIMHQEHPEALSQLSKGHPYDMSTNIFDRLPQIFYDEMPDDGEEYIQVYGREGNTRVYKYLKAKYANEPANLYKYKIHLPSANGNGVFGETLTQPILNGPGIGATETFISVGMCDTDLEAQHMLSYIKTKFLRAMLNVLKITQHLTPEVWKYVPLQDFTPSSDIDWSQSISDIDRQLYRKYGLSAEEIDFIETHVKEMT